MEIKLDNGYSFGEGVFETIKVINNKAMFLNKHLKRLNNSLEFLKINKEINEDIIYSFMENISEKDYVLKIMVSSLNTILTTREDNYLNINRKQGQRLNISKVLRNSTSKMVYHKSFNYYDNILEKRNSKEMGYDEALFINEKGLVAEGAVSNIFFVKEDKIYTPRITAGILNGTMREYIIENYNVEEKDILKEELKDFSSAFITNSLMGVMWVKSIDNINYKESELTKKIIEDLEKLGF